MSTLKRKYSETSLYRPTMGPTLSGRFREVVGLGCLEYLNGRSFGTEIKRSIQGSGRSGEVVG